MSAIPWEALIDAFETSDRETVAGKLEDAVLVLEDHREAIHRSAEDQAYIRVLCTALCALWLRHGSHYPASYVSEAVVDHTHRLSLDRPLRTEPLGVLVLRDDPHA